MKFPFLTANWANLIVVNYEVPTEVIKLFIPRETELDLYNEKALISLVAFRFKNNKLFGIIPSIPKSFDEINLRFYLRCHRDMGERKGVAFVKEFVPSQLIAGIARTLYEEPYESVPMHHNLSAFDDEKGGTLSYSLKKNSQTYSITATTQGKLRELPPHSLEEFILEHYWGYTARSDGSTSEYEVKHPRWKVWDVAEIQVSENFRDLYNPVFKQALTSKPHSAFIAKGSPVSVYIGRRLRASKNKKGESGPLGWVLYDAACGFCSWWIPFWRKTIQRTGYDIAPVQSKWVKDKLNLPTDKLNNDIRLLLKNGTLINGADAYIFGMKRVWWSRPLGLFLGLPGIRWVTWRFYKLFNRNRFFISKACRLPPQLPHEPSNKG